MTRSVVVTGMMLGFIGICQYCHLAFTTIPGNYVVYATLANKNLFSSALFLALPFVIYGLIQYSGFWRIVSLVSMVIICFNIITAGSRTIWGALVLSAIATLSFVLLCYKKNKIAKNNICFFCLIGASGVILLAILIQCTFTEKKIGSILSPASLNERILLWDKSLQMINDNPLLGVGMGQWKIALPHYGKIEKKWKSVEIFDEVCYQRPHNDYLWVLSETGPLGLFCYLSFFFTLIFYVIRIILKSEDEEKKIFSILMLSGVIGYMTVSFFSFPRERIVHNILLMVTSACILDLPSVISCSKEGP